jgi:DnaD/phage-associated family protein
MNDQLNFGKDSIYREGYGIVAKTVMRNKDLSAEAKAIYSYICSFAGSGTTAFPSAELMMHELNLGDNRFYKYRKELVDKGYITIIKQRNGSRREKNIYQIEIEPSKVLEHRQNKGIEDEHRHFEHRQNESLQNESVENDGSNNNSITINNLNSNSPNILLLLYEKIGFGTINDISKTDLEVLAKEYTETWVAEAMKEANEQGIRNLKYVKGILSNWKTKGFKAKKGGKSNGTSSKSNENTGAEGPQYNFSCFE